MTAAPKPHFTGQWTDEKNNKYWFADGKLHREEGPAVEKWNGTVYWYYKGEKHRDGDQPAVRHRDGTQIWYHHGKRHRLSGPATIETWRAWNRESWYLNGELHREHGPAVTDRQGVEKWYRFGKLHREDGPAVTMGDGRQFWYLNGEKLPGGARELEEFHATSRMKAEEKRLQEVEREVVEGLSLQNELPVSAPLRPRKRPGGLTP